MGIEETHRRGRRVRRGGGAEDRKRGKFNTKALRHEVQRRQN